MNVPLYVDNLKCPCCGSHDISELGATMSTSFNDIDTAKCNECGKEFGGYFPLDWKDNGTIETYKDEKIIMGFKVPRNTMFDFISITIPEKNISFNTYKKLAYLKTHPIYFIPVKYWNEFEISEKIEYEAKIGHDN